MIIRTDNANKYPCMMRSTPNRKINCVGDKCPIWRFMDLKRYPMFKDIKLKESGYCGLGGKPHVILIENRR